MPRKILIVDDSPTVRMTVGLALKQVGYEVVEAVDGVDGAAKVKADPQLGMMILDVNMPRMSGFELLESLNQGGGLKLPVLMLTSEGDQSMLDRARKAGAKGYVIKPFKAEALVSAVKKMILP